MKIKEQKILSRDLNRQSPLTDHYKKNVRRWAVLVGISKYQHEPWNLNYAHHDAEALFELLQKPSSGFFNSDIKLLCNEDATSRNIRSALMSFLRQPSREDLVLLFIACHGTPDPEFPEYTYLLTHDTDPKEIAATALSMEEVKKALTRFVKAERVIIFVDACHSARIATDDLYDSRAVGDENRAAVLNKYLDELSRTRAGIAMLTSAEANELAREDKKWGDGRDGHGVFTHFLLKGLAGEADINPKDGRVTVSELFEYVRENVKKATRDSQHPYIGNTKFDRDWPLAITARLSVDEYFKLGSCLYELGQRLRDRYTLESALMQFGECLKFVRDESVKDLLPKVHQECGRVHMALKNFTDAADSFEKAAENDEGVPEVNFHLGIALARIGKRKKAIEALKQFVEEQENHRLSNWARKILDFMFEAESGGDRYALLIGVDSYKSEPSLKLSSVQKDISLIEKVLKDKLGLKSENVKKLTGSNATYNEIENAFERLADKVKSNMCAIVFYSGQSIKNDPEHYLLTYDSEYSRDLKTGSFFGEYQNAFSHKKVNEMMLSLRTLHKTLILDTNPNEALMKIANEQQFSDQYLNEYILITSNPCREFRLNSEESCGLLTHCLEQAMRKINFDLATFTDLVNKAGEIVATVNPPVQASIIATGRLERLLKGFELECLRLHEFIERRSYVDLKVNELEYLDEIWSNELPELFLTSLGAAFLEKMEFKRAKSTLEKAKKSCARCDAGIWLALSQAQFMSGAYKNAKNTLGELEKVESELDSSLLKTTRQDIEDFAARTQKKYAMLVLNSDGLPIGFHYPGLVTEGEQSPFLPNLWSRQIQPKPGGPELIPRIIQNLKAFGFTIIKPDFRLEGDKTLPLFINPDEAQLLDGFKELAKYSQTAPALFIYIGSLSSRGLVCFSKLDGNQLFLRLPRQLAGIPPSRTRIVEWKKIEHYANEYGEYLTSIFIGPRWYYHTFPLLFDVVIPKIGRSSIVNMLPDNRILSFGGQAQSTQPRPWVEPFLPKSDQIGVFQGKFQFLIDLSERPDQMLSLTFRQIEDRYHSVEIKTDEPDYSFFADSPLERKIQRQMIQLSNGFLKQLIELQKKHCNQLGDNFPEGHFNLGLAYGANGELEAAINALKKAIEQKKDYVEAKYHLGRLYVENREYREAGIQLREARKINPEYTSLYRYLSEAIVMEFKQALLAEAEEALSRYKEGGAPLGPVEEIEKEILALQQARLN